jgi:hypothetical protein
MKDITYFSILLLLFMSVYTLLGLELFAFKARFNENDEPDPDGSFPDSTFNNFIEAFVSVFIVLANDGWSTIYLNMFRTAG